MRCALIALLSSLSFAAPAQANPDCAFSRVGYNVCVHRVTSSATAPLLKTVYYSVDTGEMLYAVVDCSDRTVYDPVKNTWRPVERASAFDRSCTHWHR